MIDAISVATELTTDALVHRLGQLALAERRVQVEFLLHLDEFDRRRAYLEAGYGSLWEYCLRALHLREGAAGRRIGAMRVLRRFPTLREPLRDGRLCLSTASLLGQVLTDQNLEELVARAAHKTKEEVDHLVATLRPRTAPREGIRQLPTPSRITPAGSVSAPLPLDPTPPTSVVRAGGAADAPTRAVLAMDAPRCPAALHADTPPAAPADEHCNRDPSMERSGPAPRVHAVSEKEWSLTVTLDSAAKKDLELLGALLSHKCGRNISAVLREAIRCGIEKHGKRRGAVPPHRNRKTPPRSVSTPAKAREERSRSIPAERNGSIPAERSRSIPAEVRRQVFERDGGSCTWIGHEGRQCGSRHQLELDHIRPFELGGPSTVSNLRLLCKAHNLLHAEQVFGREHMAQFRNREPAPRSLERAASA